MRLLYATALGLALTATAVFAGECDDDFKARLDACQLSATSGQPCDAEKCVSCTGDDAAQLVAPFDAACVALPTASCTVPNAGAPDGTVELGTVDQLAKCGAPTPPEEPEADPSALPPCWDEQYVATDDFAKETRGRYQLGPVNDAGHYAYLYDRVDCIEGAAATRFHCPDCVKFDPKNLAVNGPKLRYFFDKNGFMVWDQSTCVAVGDLTWDFAHKNAAKEGHVADGLSVHASPAGLYCQRRIACEACAHVTQSALRSDDKTFEYRNCHTDDTCHFTQKALNVAVCDAYMVLSYDKAHKAHVVKVPGRWWHSTFVNGAPCPPKGCGPPAAGPAGSSKMAGLSSFSVLCFLLVFGKFLRMKIPILARLYLPSSVIGGLVGLIVISLFKESPSAYAYVQKEYLVGWNKLAGFLINIVFASLFLGQNIPAAGEVWHRSGPQLMYGMVVAWGQWVAAMLVTGLVLVPVWGVSPLFGSLLPIGFAGGHGTAAGLADTYTLLGMPSGGAFGLASATIGLVCSILFGVMWVNIAVKFGWTKKDKMDNATDAVISISGVYGKDDRPIAGVQTVKSDSIDTLALHLAFIGIAVLIGYLCKRTLMAIESTSDSLAEIGFLSGFPLFPLCMAGSIIVQKVMVWYDPDERLIDSSLMERLSGTSLDFLITAAVAAVDLSALGDEIVPFLILMGTGFLWHFIVLGLIARHLLPNHWFERAIPELGMSMGVIASGLVLLRTVDPESRTPVPADFAYKQLLHSPFMGGGLWTAMSLPLIAKAGLWPSTIIMIIVLFVWFALWAWYFRPKYEECTCSLCAPEGANGSYEPPTRNSMMLGGRYSVNKGAKGDGDGLVALSTF